MNTVSLLETANCLLKSSDLRTVAEEVKEWDNVERGGVVYKKKQLIGVGRYGCVFNFEAVTKKNIRTNVAVKVFIKDYNVKLIQKEILAVMHAIPDQDRLYFVGMFDYFPVENHFICIYEKMHSTLHTTLQNYKDVLPKGVIITILRQLLLALNALQKNKIIHRNICLKTIMMGAPWDPCAVKISDFLHCQIANNINNSSILPSKENVQSQECRAPEVILGIPYSFPVDMWSIGVVAAHLFYKRSIFFSPNNYELLHSIDKMAGDIPDYMLAEGIFTDQYFDMTEVIGFNTPAYHLKNRNEVYKNSQPPENDSDFSKLAFNHPHFSPNEIICYNSLLTSMLRVDPSQRAFPSSALLNSLFTNK